MSNITNHEIQSAEEHTICALSGVSVEHHTAGIEIGTVFISLLGLKSVGVSGVYDNETITIHSMEADSRCTECGNTTEVAILNGQDELDDSIRLCQSCLQELSQETVEFISENPETVLTDVIF